MGLLTCDIHGVTGVMANASKDLCDFIKNKIVIGKVKIKVFNVAYYDGDDFLVDENFFFTENEYNKLNLKKEYKISNSKEENEFSKIIKNKTGVVCVKCFKKYMDLINYNYNFYEENDE